MLLTILYILIGLVLLVVLIAVGVCPPGIRFANLPRIDVLLLSHNHWDHLEISTVTKVCTQHQPMVFCPLGLAIHFGTFPLADDDETEPVQDLQLALDARHIPAGRFRALKNGGSLVV